MIVIRQAWAWPFMRHCMTESLDPPYIVMMLGKIVYEPKNGIINDR